MKRQFKIMVLPIGMGLSLTILTVFALSPTLTSCDKLAATTTKNCTNSAYPLWCASVKVCCPAGNAHYCDGKCYSTDCPSATIMRDNCYPE